MLISTAKSRKQKKSNTSPPIINDVCDIPDETGLLLFRSLDPLSILFSHITKQDYALIGSYSKFITNDGTTRYKIKIVNIFNGEEPIWARNIVYLSEAEDYEFIQKIILFPYILSEKTASTISCDDNINDRLMDLFGRDICSFPIIQHYILLLGNSSNNIYNLIADSPLISKDIKIITPKGYLSRNFTRDRFYLQEVITVFVNMILDNPQFLNIITEYFTYTHPYDVLYNKLEEHVGIEHDMIKIIQDWFETRKIDKSSLSSLLTKLNTNIAVSAISEGCDEIPDDIIVLDKTPPPIIVDSIRIMRDQIDRISNTINNNNIPCIELNNIISTVNNLANYYNLPLINTIDQPYSGIISISSQSEMVIPVTLKTGNQITLTTHNFNLSLFTKEELTEILEIINAMALNDKYEFLCTEIIREISNNH